MAYRRVEWVDDRGASLACGINVDVMHGVFVLPLIDELGGVLVVYWVYARVVTAEVADQTDCLVLAYGWGHFCSSSVVVGSSVLGSSTLACLHFSGLRTE